MKDHAHQLAIETMCNVLQVSCSGCYEWLNKKSSARKQKNGELLEKIRSIYYRSKKRYGSPKLTMALQALSYQVSRPSVARLMKANNLRSIVHKEFKVR